MKNFNQVPTVTTYLFQVKECTFYNEWHSYGELKVFCDGEPQSFFKINKKHFAQKLNNFETNLISQNIDFKKEVIQKF
jgi:hypothetical protein